MHVQVPMPVQRLQSQIDRSVNFVREAGDGGAFEARYVRRAGDYIVVYLSSHSGCRQGCRFCHLTATKQTMMAPASYDSFLEQAEDVLSYYDSVRETEGAAGRVHFNWMARGEALANPTVLERFRELTGALAARCHGRGLVPIFNVSSILPHSFGGYDLSSVLAADSGEVVLYYSLYSLDEDFRRRWLPTALPAEEGLRRVAEYQQATGRRIALHWAYIEGENDSPEDAEKIAEAVARLGIRAKFNLVRYNPYGTRNGREAAEERLHENFAIVASVLNEPGSRIIPRVGFDVKASCGMFVETQRRAS